MRITPTHIEAAKRKILAQAQAFRVLRHKTAAKVKVLTKKTNALSRGTPSLIKMTELNELTTQLFHLRSVVDISRRGVELNAECFNNELKKLGEKHKAQLIRIDELLANREQKVKEVKVKKPASKPALVLPKAGFQRFAGETVVHISKNRDLLGRNNRSSQI